MPAHSRLQSVIGAGPEPSVILFPQSDVQKQKVKTTERAESTRKRALTALRRIFETSIDVVSTIAVGDAALYCHTNRVRVVRPSERAPVNVVPIAS